MMMDTKKLLSNVKRRRIKPDVGDYVFAAKCRNADLRDPHSVGFVVGIDEVRGVTYYNVRWGLTDSQWRSYRHAWKITPEEGVKLLEYSGQYQKFYYPGADPELIYQTVWTDAEAITPTHIALVPIEKAPDGCILHSGGEDA